MEWSTAAVGFGSALLGAMLGFAGSVYRTNQEQAKREQGVVRALLGELVDNTTFALMATTGHKKLGSISTSVWNDAKLQIAQVTSRKMFGTLVGVYSSTRLMESAREELEARNPNAIEALGLWYSAARQSHNMLLQEFPRATAGWNEMAPFHAALDELKEK